MLPAETAEEGEEGEEEEVVVVVVMAAVEAVGAVEVAELQTKTAERCHISTWRLGTGRNAPLRARGDSYQEEEEGVPTA
eukprot:COSAG02_NODE_17927_length_971_cov_0.958716_1_plen_79_part_00